MPSGTARASTPRAQRSKWRPSCPRRSGGKDGGGLRRRDAAQWCGQCLSVCFGRAGGSLLEARVYCTENVQVVNVVVLRSFAFTMETVFVPRSEG